MSGAMFGKVGRAQGGGVYVSGSDAAALVRETKEAVAEVGGVAVDVAHGAMRGVKSGIVLGLLGACAYGVVSAIASSGSSSTPSSSAKTDVPRPVTLPKPAHRDPVRVTKTCSPETSRSLHGVVIDTRTSRIVDRFALIPGDREALKGIEGGRAFVEVTGNQLTLTSDGRIEMCCVDTERLTEQDGHVFWSWIDEAFSWPTGRDGMAMIGDRYLFTFHWL